MIYMSYINCLSLIYFQYQTNEMHREVHAKERLEEELKETSLNLERKESEVTNLKHQLGQAQFNIGKLKTSAKDLKVLNGRKQWNKMYGHICMTSSVSCMELKLFCKENPPYNIDDAFLDQDLMPLW